MTITVLRALVAIVVAAALWLPALHLFYGRSPRELAGPLVAAQLADDGGAERARMRRTNPEWDLMGRLFLVGALANRALADTSARATHLAAIDRLLDETLADDARGGPFVFLLPYAHAGSFAANPPRSLFVDSELALMIGLRRLIADDARWQAAHRERVERVSKALGGAAWAESYPDECWTFDHAVALAALRIADRVDGRGDGRDAHAAVIAATLARMKRELVDGTTGLLVSSFGRDGRARDGAEGSTIWMTIHCLALVDAPLARDQYARAKAALGHRFLGFGWAGEWPAGKRDAVDIDSGPVIPLLDVSPGSSGLMFLAAATVGDDETLRALTATLELAAFPMRDRDGRLRFAASNQVGDAAIAYALSVGPAWERAR